MRRTAALAGMVVLAALGGVGLGVAPAASAQTYPPGPCRPLVSTQVVGTFNVGQTFPIVFSPSCAFQDGTPVTKTVNGVGVGVVPAVNGDASLTVTVVSTTTLSIDDPVLVPNICGENTATATGFSAAAQADVTQIAKFNVNCGAGVPVPAGPAGATPVALRPAEVAATIVTPAPARTGPLAFTGAHLLELVLIALSVVAIGAVVVLTSRRKAARTT